MSFFELLPGINAALNGTSIVCLVAAYVSVRRKNIERHKKLMLSAVSASALFLVGYVTRMLVVGTHRFPEVGLWKTVYLAILMTHMVLATLVLPFILRSVYLGLRRDVARHRRIAKLTFPVWLYVSVTGVLVYFMLYHLAPRLSLASS